MSNKNSKIKKIRIFGILKNTLINWVKGFNNYSKLVLVVAVPVAILTIVQADGNTGDFGLIMAFAWAFAVMAVIVYGKNRQKLEKVKISQIFSQGSGRFFQYIGTSLLLIVLAIPAIAGATALLTAFTQPGSNSLILIALGVAGVIISIFLMIRFSLSQVIAVGENKSVYQSFLISQRITKGNRLKIFIGFLIIFGLIVLIANGVQLLLGIKQTINENIYINNIVYVIEATLFLPIVYLYQILLVEELNG